MTVADLFEKTDPPAAIKKRWVPERYVDEVTPPARATPTDWVMRRGSSFVLAPAFDEAEPRWLRDGEVVEFSWTEAHGTAQLTIADDGTWTCTRDMPETEGGTMLVIFDGDWETMDESIASLVENNSLNGGEPGEHDIRFYAWSDKTTKFRFRDGAFHTLEAAAAATH